jgi:cell division protein FtsX
MLVVVMLLTGLVAAPRAWGAADAPREVAVDTLGSAVDAEIFMDVNATPQEVAGVRTAILQDGAEIARFEHLSKHDAYEEFKRLFGKDLNLVARTNPKELPESFRVELHQGVTFRSTQRRFDALPGVDQVVKPAILPTKISAKKLLDLCESAKQARRYYNANVVLVFLAVDPKKTAVAVVRTAIESSPLVKQFTYLDHQAALKEFRHLFRRHPQIIAGTRASDLPESFRVTVVNRTSVNAFIAGMRVLSSVDTVTTPTPPGDALLQACAASQASPGR